MHFKIELSLSLHSCISRDTKNTIHISRINIELCCITPVFKAKIINNIFLFFLLSGSKNSEILSQAIKEIIICIK